MNLVLATNNEALVEAFRKYGKYNIVSVFDQRDKLEDTYDFLDIQPDTMLITEGFDCQGTSVADMLTGLKKKHPELRIIYILGNEFNNGTKKILTKLVENGIYDIAMGDEVSMNSLINLIENPRSYADASKILEDDDSEVYNNVITFSSLKPGTGKTFMATNVAVAIAKYGVKTRMSNGRFRDPRVLLVDGDLSNLGAGNILRTDNCDKNMLTALQRIAKNVGEDCHYSMSETDIESLKTFVRGCLYNYKDCPNLYIMGASSISLNELEKIAPVHFYFMMQMLVKAFDVIIVDSNSAFDHQTTAVLYEISGRIYLLMDNDYNNIQNNLRYIDKLIELGYDDKIVFAVNKDITKEAELSCLQALKYDTSSIGNLVIDYRIPLIDAGIVKTLDYGEGLVVTSLKAIEARDRILELADGIWKIDFTRVQSPSEETTKKQSRLVNLLNN